ncbi:MAG: hypothetical protein K8L99_17015 [Anaerolineae bacterium]|nr:hypothetical protein [Anaerolineae bacterium]
MDQGSIPKLSWRDHVRLRPKMYFGGVDRRGIHEMILRILENSVAQALRGTCDEISLTLVDDVTITIADNGPGIPTQVYKDTGKTVLELVLSEGGGKSFNEETGWFSGGMFGAGIASVNAVASRMEVEVKRDGSVWLQSYTAGLPDNPMQVIRKMRDGEKTGTRITFSPDFDIFDLNAFHLGFLTHRLQELSYLIPQVTFSLRYPAAGGTTTETVFRTEHGILDWLTVLNRDKKPLHAPLAITFTEEIPSRSGHTPPTLIHADIVVQYTDDRAFFPLSYASTIETSAGGTHVDGVLDALMLWVNTNVSRQGDFETNIHSMTLREIANGLTLIVSVHHPAPQFESSHFLHLLNPEVREVIYKAMTAQLEQLIEQDSDTAQAIIARCTQNHTENRQRFE